MKFVEPNTGDRVELALLQIDISGHSKLPGTDRALQQAKETLRQYAEGIAAIHGGKLFAYAGDGGAFMFRTRDGGGVDDMAFAALQILSTLPATNEQIKLTAKIAEALRLRISCDMGVVTYHSDTALITADFLNAFFKHERDISVANSITVTARVHKQLSPELRRKFVPFKRAVELETDLFNSGGKDAQLQTLKSLQNVIPIDGKQQPNPNAQSVEIVAFKGDNLTELSKAAYEDVVIRGHENLECLNLLLLKNAERCLGHHDRGDESGDDIPDSLRRKLVDVSPELLSHVKRIWPKLDAQMRQEITSRASGMSASQLAEFLEELDLFDVRAHAGRAPEADHVFEGGESVRFFNCAALGFAPFFPPGSEIDLVLAKELVIAEVLAGVDDTVAPIRVFENHNGEFVQVGDERQAKAPRRKKPGPDDEPPPSSLP